MSPYLAFCHLHVASADRWDSHLPQMRYSGEEVIIQVLDMLHKTAVDQIILLSQNKNRTLHLCPLKMNFKLIISLLMCKHSWDFFHFLFTSTVCVTGNCFLAARGQYPPAHERRPLWLVALNSTFFCVLIMRFFLRTWKMI